MPEQVRDRRMLLGGVLVGVAALAVMLLDGPRRTAWWYPETDAYQLWVLVLVVLGVAAFVGARHLAFRAGWAAALGVSGAGVLALTGHIIFGYTPGDLLRNYLEGARRVRDGARVYDLAGLQESVNASPLAILAFVPLAPLSNYPAIICNVLMTALALVGFAAAAVAMLRRIKGSDGVADLFIVVCTATTFYTFQRSWRLGQIDTTLLALLAVALWQLTRERVGRVDWAAATAAAATGLKLAPAIAAIPFIVRGLSRRDDAARARARRFVRAWAGWLLGIVVLCALTLGPGTVYDFARALPGISQGSTSGNNYALAARIGTWGDRARRHDHHLPGAGQQALQTALALALLAAGGALTLRLRHARPALLMALWLAGLPLVAPVCWDVYLLWCGYLPWLVLWGELAARWRRARAPATLLAAVFCAGAFLIGGTAGNTAYRMLETGWVAQLHLPVWLDEAPLAGHLMTVATLVWAAVTQDRAARAAAAGPHAGAALE